MANRIASNASVEMEGRRFRIKLENGEYRLELIDSNGLVKTPDTGSLQSTCDLRDFLTYLNDQITVQGVVDQHSVDSRIFADWESVDIKEFAQVLRAIYDNNETAKQIIQDPHKLTFFTLYTGCELLMKFQRHAEIEATPAAEENALQSIMDLLPLLQTKGKSLQDVNLFLDPVNDFLYVKTTQGNSRKLSDMKDLLEENLLKWKKRHWISFCKLLNKLFVAQQSKSTHQKNVKFTGEKATELLDFWHKASSAMEEVVKHDNVVAAEEKMQNREGTGEIAQRNELTKELVKVFCLSNNILLEEPENKKLVEEVYIADRANKHKYSKVSVQQIEAVFTPPQDHQRGRSRSSSSSIFGRIMGRDHSRSRSRSRTSGSDGGQPTINSESSRSNSRSRSRVEQLRAGDEAASGLTLARSRGPSLLRRGGAWHAGADAAQHTDDTRPASPTNK
jgi:hypothetical protein